MSPLGCRTLSLTEGGRKALILQEMKELGWEVLWMQANGKTVYVGPEVDMARSAARGELVYVGPTSWEWP